jgi:hypothetical protein
MRVGGALLIGLVMAFPTGCGVHHPGTTQDHSGVAGRVRVGPQCPVQTEGDPCEDKPGAGARVTVAKQPPGGSDAGGDVVARTTTDADGNYRVAVPPGTYVVTAQAGMSCDLRTIRVSTGVYSRVDIPCDTGIR